MADLAAHEKALADLTELSEKLAKARSEIEQLKSRDLSVVDPQDQNQTDAASKARQEESEEEIKTLKFKLDKSASLAVKLKERIAKDKQKTTALQELWTSLKEDIARMDKVKADKVKDDAEIEALKVKLGEIPLLQEELSKINTANATLQAMKDSFTDEVAQMDELKAEKADDEEKIKTLILDLEEQKGELKKADMAKAALRSTWDSLNQDTERMTQLEMDLATSEALRAKAEAELQTLKDASPEQDGQSPVTDTASETDAIAEKLRSCELDRSNLTAIIERLEMELGDSKALYLSIGDSLGVVTRQRDQARESSDRFKQDAEVKAAEIFQLEQKIDVVNHALQKHELQETEFQAEIVLLKKELEGMQALKISIGDVLQAVTDQRDQARELSEVAKQKADDKDIRIARLEQDLDDCVGALRVSNTAQELQTCEEERGHLATEVERLNDELQKMANLKDVVGQILITITAQRDQAVQLLDTVRLENNTAHAEKAEALGLYDALLAENIALENKHAIVEKEVPLLKTREADLRRQWNEAREIAATPFNESEEIQRLTKELADERLLQKNLVDPAFSSMLNDTMNVVIKQRDALRIEAKELAGKLIQLRNNSADPAKKKIVDQREYVYKVMKERAAAKAALVLMTADRDCQAALLAECKLEFPNTAKLTELKASFDDTVKSARATDNELAKVESLLKMCQDSRPVDIKMTALEKHIVNLEARLAGEYDRRDEFIEEAAEMDAQLETWKRRAGEAGTAQEEMQLAYKKLEAENGHLLKEIDDLNRRLDALGSDIPDDNERFDATALKLLETCQENRKDLENEIAKLKFELSTRKSVSLSPTIVADESSKELLSRTKALQETVGVLNQVIAQRDAVIAQQGGQSLIEEANKLRTEVMRLQRQIEKSVLEKDHAKLQTKSDTLLVQGSSPLTPPNSNESPEKANPSIVQQALRAVVDTLETRKQALEEQVSTLVTDRDQLLQQIAAAPSTPSSAAIADDNETKLARLQFKLKMAARVNTNMTLERDELIGAANTQLRKMAAVRRAAESLGFWLSITRRMKFLSRDGAEPESTKNPKQFKLGGVDWEPSNGTAAGEGETGPVVLMMDGDPVSYIRWLRDNVDELRLRLSDYKVSDSEQQMKEVRAQKTGLEGDLKALRGEKLLVRWGLWRGSVE